jgi:hypothetical protein
MFNGSKQILLVNPGRITHPALRSTTISSGGTEHVGRAAVSVVW